jgi:uncharacterized protein YukJ
LSNYCLVKGDPANAGEVQFNSEGKNPHYHVTLNTDSGPFDVAINIESEDGSEVLYTVDHAFVPPDKDALIALPMSRQTLVSQPGGLALDYVRETVDGAAMVDRGTMQLLPKTFPAGHRHNDLNNEVVDLLNRATADPNGTVYAFGNGYADSNSQGVHDIHMNQGNPAQGGHAQDNGIWQDGGVFVHLPEQDQWIAIFIAFQTQSWQTDDNGDPLSARAEVAN